MNTEELQREATRVRFVRNLMKDALGSDDVLAKIAMQEISQILGPPPPECEHPFSSVVFPEDGPAYCKDCEAS